MKILFAVNNDNVLDAIVKKYQKDYKEILSYKNVYYFNAIYRELQKDKSYSRVVISEDLEPFANNNYSSIDKFLLDKYTNIAEEAKGLNNEKIDIILICADRRRKTDDMLGKLYKLGIYNAIIGQDRSIDEVCKLIYRPRDKESAKIYYEIHESELNDDSENSVSEAEVENIRAHYARLGKNEDKYIDSFNNIVSQYTDSQLKIIIKYLPMNVKAVLEERSPKYQQLVTNSAINGFDARGRTESYKDKIRKKEENDELGLDLLEDFAKPKTIKSVVIPTSLETQKIQKVIIPNVAKPDIKPSAIVDVENIDNHNKIENTQPKIEEKVEEKAEEPEKKEETIIPPKKGRGRPRKNPLPEVDEEKPKRGRGRPRKNPLPEENEKIEEQKQEEPNLFEIDEEKEEKGQEVDLFNLDEPETEQEVDLFNMEDEKINQEQEPDLFGLEEQEEHREEHHEEPTIKPTNIENVRPVEPQTNSSNMFSENNSITTSNYSSPSFNALLTSDRKLVAFVGTTKNGTSFVVNNTAEMLSSMGIETAILDMTKSKNAYYIYTNNEENLRNIAKNCMDNLQRGVTEGIKVNKNLTIYTEMPGDERDYKIETILTALLNRYSAVLIDTDFETDPEIFAKAQEIYLVQTMDVLTIQPLTAFLRNLKSKGILSPEKLKIVINKSERVRNLNVKTLIGGMSCYNSPNMTYMTELFDRDNIMFCEIPFEVQNYIKYLESLVNCSISLNGYTKTFLESLRQLANMVYPLVGRQNYSGGKNENREPFSSQVNETLSRMKSRY